jgi:hypothetical protein
MMGLSNFVRNAPKLFYVLAAVDLLKNLLPFVQLYADGRFRGMEYGSSMGLQLLAIGLSAIVYAASWIAYGVVATLLIALYDEVAAMRAGPGDVSNA